MLGNLFSGAMTLKIDKTKLLLNLIRKIYGPMQKMKTMRFYAILLLASVVINSAAQEESRVKSQSTRHTLDAGFGFTFVPVAGEINQTQASGLFTPTVSLDYFLNLHKRWELGIMASYELNHYMIIDSQIERENAIQVALVGMFKISPHWAVFTGGGIEIEPHDNLAIFRLGGQYTIDLKNSWAVLPRLYFDFKENYDTWSFQVSVGKKF